MPVINVKGSLQKMNLLKKKKKVQYPHNLFNNLSKEKKTDTVNMHVKNTVIFPKNKEIKSVNVFANDIKIFLKSFNFRWQLQTSISLLVFSGKHKRVFLRVKQLEYGDFLVLTKSSRNAAVLAQSF